MHIRVLYTASIGTTVQFIAQFILNLCHTDTLTCMPTDLQYCELRVDLCIYNCRHVLKEYNRDIPGTSITNIVGHSSRAQYDELLLSTIYVYRMNIFYSQYPVPQSGHTR